MTACGNNKINETTAEAAPVIDNFVEAFELLKQESSKILH